MDRIAAAFGVEGLVMDLGTVLRWTAARHPHRRAIGGDKPFTYAEWDAHTDRLAAALVESGVRRGDRIVLMLAGGEPLASLHMAAQKIGAISVPLSTRLAPTELAYCVADCSPALVVDDDSTAGSVDEALAGAAPVARVRSGAVAADTIERSAARKTGLPPTRVMRGDISVLLYTSGTTGRPKGVPRSHEAEHYASLAHLLQSGQSRLDITLGVMPLFHTMGLRTLLATVVGGGTWVPLVQFEADAALELIIAERVNMLFLVPTIYWALLQTGRFASADSVRKIAYAGASMTPDLIQSLVSELAPESFVNHVGSTEIYTFTVGANMLAKPGCAGRAGVFSRTRLVAVDPTAGPEDIVAPGEQGQLAVCLDSAEAFKGYWRRPDADARSIRQGWYFPGDLAVQDDEGDLWISGRVDDMINSGGENIFPDEIERALRGCSVVRDLTVAGVADDRWGQAVTAFFVPHEGLSPERAIAALEEYARVRSGLPSLKRPKRYIAVAEIPTSPVGKVLRRQLQAGRYTVLSGKTPHGPGER
ncbi:AMP-binding protein [Nocardia brasiliensis]|uniref:AMP-binding protein n=1 Tax=Nocardia brasiliensis TaxID=37326 RepID=UPI003D8E7CA5